jgi:diguanylate cyclase (GGDEF)-like protein
MTLDTQTLLFSLMLIDALIALSLAIISLRGRRWGLNKWAGAIALESLVWMLVAARGEIPDIFSISIASIAMISAQAMKLAAVYEYRGRDWPRLQCLLPVSSICLVLLVLQQDNTRDRMVFSSFILAAQMLILVQALQTDTESRTGRAWRLLFGSAVMTLPILALRAMVAFWDIYPFATPNGVVAPNPLQMAAFVCMIALDLLGSIGFILMIKERAEREIRALAMTDSLTNIFNRRAFMGMAEKELAAAQRNHLSLALLMIDIDYLKRINDEHGHSAGDAVLADVAGLLASRLRKQDTVGRYGGEEFCVLLPATDEAGALALAEKLRHAVEAMPVTIGQSSTSVTISIGIAVCQATGGTGPIDFSRVLEDADAALYQAKREGRNRTVNLDLGSLTAQSC